jgi:hypothetical protein
MRRLWRLLDNTQHPPDPDTQTKVGTPMAFPVVGKSVGSGVDQLKAQIVGWIRDEIRASQRGGIGIAADVVYGTTANLTLTTAWTTLKTATITVPGGMTSAAVSVTSRVYAINSTGAPDWFQARTIIAGTNGNSFPLLCPAGGSGLNVAPLAVDLSGLVPGTTFTIMTEAMSTTAAWATNAANTAEISGSILWFR